MKTSSAMDQSYSDNRSDTIVRSVGPFDILPCSVRRSDDFGILCTGDSPIHIDLPSVLHTNKNHIYLNYIQCVFFMGRFGVTGRL